MQFHFKKMINGLESHLPTANVPDVSLQSNVPVTVTKRQPGVSLRESVAESRCCKPGQVKVVSGEHHAAHGLPVGGMAECLGPDGAAKDGKSHPDGPQKAPRVLPPGYGRENTK